MYSIFEYTYTSWCILSLKIYGFPGIPKNNPEDPEGPITTHCSKGEELIIGTESSLKEFFVAYQMYFWFLLLAK